MPWSHLKNKEFRYVYYKNCAILPGSKVYHEALAQVVFLALGNLKSID